MPVGQSSYSTWRQLAAITLLAVSLTTLLLQIQYVVTYRRSLDDVVTFHQDIRDVTPSGGHSLYEQFHIENTKPTPVFTIAPDITNGSTVSLAIKEHCPTHNYTSVCHVEIYGDPWKMRTRDRTIRPGYIRVNNMTMFEWHHAPNCVLVRLNLKCRLMDVVQYRSTDERDPISQKWTNISTYLHSLPNRTIIAGTCFGRTLQLDGLVGFGIRKKSVDGLNKRKGAISFLGWTGYPGHTRYRTTPAGRAVNSLISDFYVGTLFNYTDRKLAYTTTLSHHIGLKHGGHWHPGICRPRWRIALIVPFRRREEHLMIFLDNMIRFLQLQQLAFSIFVVEQAEPELFNRAALMNIGYLEAQKLNYDCYVFHDVDLIPEDLANVYACSDTPRHLIVTRSVTRYEMRFPNYFGGGIMMSARTIELINGFPNRLFGWGGEDDNIYARVNHTGIGISRYPLEIGRYYSLPHGADKGNPHMKRNVNEIYSQASETDEDGLNTTQYTLLAIETRTLYTHMFVRIPGPVSREDASNMTNT